MSHVEESSSWWLGHATVLLRKWQEENEPDDGEDIIDIDYYLLKRSGKNGGIVLSILTNMYYNVNDFLTTTSDDNVGHTRSARFYP